MTALALGKLEEACWGSGGVIGFCLFDPVRFPSTPVPFDFGAEYVAFDMSNQPYNSPPKLPMLLLQEFGSNHSQGRELLQPSCNLHDVLLFSGH